MNLRPGISATRHLLLHTPQALCTLAKSHLAPRANAVSAAVPQPAAELSQGVGPFGLGPLVPDEIVLVAVDWPDGPGSPPREPSSWTRYGPFPVNGFIDIVQ